MNFEAPNPISEERGRLGRSIKTKPEQDFYLSEDEEQENIVNRNDKLRKTVGVEELADESLNPLEQMIKREEEAEEDGETVEEKENEVAAEVEEEEETRESSYAGEKAVEAARQGEISEKGEYEEYDPNLPKNESMGHGSYSIDEEMIRAVRKGDGDDPQWKKIFTRAIEKIRRGKIEGR